MVEEKHSRHPSTAGVPILSFFTGAGFLDIGFIEAGFKNIIWRNECNPFFVKGFQYGMSNLYQKNGLHGIINSPKSILHVDVNQIRIEAFSEAGAPEVFGIIGGPPCPDFSVGGKNRGREGEHGKLSQVYVRRIIELKPTFFLLENVPGLLHTAKHRLFLHELKEQLRSSGYALSQKVLNALDFGVPQERKRFFLVGFDKKWLDKKLDWCVQPENEDWFPWPEARYPDAKKSFKWPKEPSPFGGNPEQPKGIPDELMVGPCISVGNGEEIESLPNGTDRFNAYSKKFQEIAEGDDSRKSFKRLHRWRYSPAAAYGNNEVHLHPTEARRLTVREAMRIQTVPDEYAFPPDMPLSHKFKMIGNGVPVKLAQAVATSFAKVLAGEVNVNI